MSNNNTGPVRYVNAIQAVDTLNEVLEHLESLCDACDSVEVLNNAIDRLLREHGVFAGEVYELT